MGERTGIAWARSTANAWIGCTEVSPGCDNCYARELDKRHRWGLKKGEGPAIGIAPHWGAGVPRYRAKNFEKSVLAWNKIAAKERASGKIEDGSKWHEPGFYPVFPSLMDPFDNGVPWEWRRDLFSLIRATPYLTYLLLTKRVGNASDMIEQAVIESCAQAGIANSGWPWPNVWLGASIVNQPELDRDGPKLIATRAARHFISYEPALGPVDFIGRDGIIDGIDWIIVGGESAQGGKPARPFVIGWARDVKRQCDAADVAFFMKQFGSYVTNREGVRHFFLDRAGSDPAEWPEDLRVQQFPKG